MARGAAQRQPAPLPLPALRGPPVRQGIADARAGDDEQALFQPNQEHGVGGADHHETAHIHRPVRLRGTENRHKAVCYQIPGRRLIKFRYSIRSSKFVSQRSIAKTLAKCGISHGTFATSKPLECPTSGQSGSRLPHGSFERSYAGFLFLSAAQAISAQLEPLNRAD
jgi:hypothetical protein